MIAWLLLTLLLIFGALIAASLLPVSLSSHLQGRLEPAGTWALALGVGKGPLAMSAIAASGVPPFIACHLFGRQLVRIPLRRSPSSRTRPSEPSAASKETPGADRQHAGSRIARRLSRGLRKLDPVDAWLAWWDKERVFEVSELELDLEYSFRDVALTGQLLAALCALSGALPERYVIQHHPVWQAEDRCLLVADLGFRIWPGRLFLGVLGFVLKQWKLGAPQPAPANE